MTERVESPSATSGKGRDPGYIEATQAEQNEAARAEEERRNAAIAAKSKTAPQGPGESGTVTGGPAESDTGTPADGLGDDGDEQAKETFDGGTPETVDSVPDDPAPGEAVPEKKKSPRSKS